MESANNLTAENVMEENPVTVQSDRRLSQVKNKMEDEEIRAIPVVSEKNKLEGVIGYRDLIRQLQFNPSKTKLSKVMHQPPSFDLEDSLVDLCDLRINSGRKLLVKEKGGKLQGVVGDQQFLDAFAEVKEVERLKTAEIANLGVLTVFEQDTLEEARHKMLDENVSRLPVRDNDGNLTGILRSTDLLKSMVPRQTQDSGGTSGRRNAGEVYMSGGGEKESMSEVPVSELMNRMVVTSEDYLKGDKAVKMMQEQESGEIVYINNKQPESILTVKDLIDFVKSLQPSDTVFVQLIGVDSDEAKDSMHEKIRTQLTGSLGRKLDRAEELSVHVKKADQDGTRQRYELIVKLHSEYGIMTVNEEGWELLNILDEALDKLNAQVRKKKEKQEERNRK